MNIRPNLLILAILLSLFLPQNVLAQEALAPTDGVQTGEAAAPALVIPDYDPRDYIPLSAIAPDGSVAVTDELVFQSLLFTQEEINTLVSTLNRRPARTTSTSSNVGTGFVGGPLGAPGVGGSEEDAEVKPYYPPISTKRIISVSGLLYRSPGDWIVWLNGHKLVPGTRLPELVDIKVERDRVHLKWFDIGMAKILSITLRPRQTYDITSGVMLTTTGGDMQ